MEGEIKEAAKALKVAEQEQKAGCTRSKWPMYEAPSQVNTHLLPL